jgi:transposase-like protein
MSGLRGRACTICLHPERAAIDQGLVLGQTVASLSRQFHVHDDALRRHKLSGHYPKASAAVVEAARKADAEAQGSTLLGVAGTLRDKAINLLGAAEASGDLRTALAGVREATRCLQLMAQLTGDVSTGAVVTVNNVTMTGNFIVVQQAILAALVDEPSARAKVIAALEQIEATAS